MSAPYNTLLLDLDDWDLCPDANGNIAMASPPYAVAQDVSSAVRTFLADCYYDQTIGIDYFGLVLGHTPPLSLFQQYIQDAAVTVPTVESAVCVVTSVRARGAQGYVAFTDENGQTGQVGL